jgi:hypothetical protein
MMIGCGSLIRIVASSSQVRVTAMVKGITKIDTDSVPPHIKSFLEKLISDGNFFRSDFLYSFERKSLEFDQ